MKARILSVSLLLFFPLFFAGCSDSPGEPDGWYDRIPDGNAFLRANTVRFYYLGSDGKSMIDPADRSTFPVSLGKELDNPLERTEDYDGDVSGLYNGNHNGILYDEEEGLYYCTMTAYGDEKQSTYSWPVYVGGYKDIVEVQYKYTDRDVVGGKYWAKIVSWKYNGQHFYSDDDEGYDKKVFITRSGEKTTVSFKRP